MWVSIAGIDDHALRHHARARGMVRLRDGRVAALVSWPGHQKRRGRYCRLETRAGTRFTVHCDLVEAIQPLDLLKGAQDG
jgi:hypothetical protein